MEQLLEFHKDNLFPIGCNHLSMVSLTHPTLGKKMAATFADDIFKSILLNEFFCMLIKISLKFVPKIPIDNNPTSV